VSAVAVCWLCVVVSVYDPTDELSAATSLTLLRDYVTVTVTYSIILDTIIIIIINGVFSVALSNKVTARSILVQIIMSWSWDALKRSMNSFKGGMQRRRSRGEGGARGRSHSYILGREYFCPSPIPSKNRQMTHAKKQQNIDLHVKFQTLFRGYPHTGGREDALSPVGRVARLVPRPFRRCSDASRLRASPRGSVPLVLGLRGVLCAIICPLDSWSR